MDTKKLATYVLTLVILGFAAAGIYALNDISIYTPDSTRYLVWARSLASFAGYQDATTPDPTRYVVHAPLYALLLAPVALAATGSIIAAKIFTLGAGCATLFFAYLWYSRSAGKGIALAGALLLALNPLFFLFSIEVLSDVPFAACLLASWLLIAKVEEDERFRPGLAALLALSVAAALLLREIGVSVLLSSVLYLAIRKRVREAAMSFAIPALIYAAWYIRNELFVAAVENPPLTNAKIFSYHFLTSADASLLQEFMARMGNNLSIYGGLVGDLLFAPLFFSMQFDLISPADPVMKGLLEILGILRWPIMAFAIASTLYGLNVDLKTSPGALLRLLFLAFYTGVMLTYPINDIRFLLPMLLLMIFYSCVGWNALRKGGVADAGMTFAGKAAVALALLFLVPNLIWNALFARTSASFTASPVAYAESVRDDRTAPTHFTKPFRLAGEWIGTNMDAGAVIMTQWKDLAVWVGDRKVLNVDQTIGLDEFESQLRDYRVGLLVSQLKRSGISEFAIQMHQTERFDFQLAHRVGNTEMYRVTERTAPHGTAADASAFDSSLTSLEKGDYAGASARLEELWKGDNRNVTALFMLAASRACGGEFDRADSLFGILRSFPQSGIYLAKAAMQQQLIQTVRSAPSVPVQEQRADMLANAAAGYWNAGLRFRARELIIEALRADSGSVAAAVFGFHFALRENDLPEATRLAGRLDQSAPQHPLVPVLRAIVGIHDTLRLVPGPELRSDLYGRLGRHFSSIGLHEDAIDCLRNAIGVRVDDADLALLLAKTYVGKRRYAPARDLLIAVLARHPEHAGAREFLASISPHL